MTLQEAPIEKAEEQMKRREITEAPENFLLNRRQKISTEVWDLNC